MRVFQGDMKRLCTILAALMVSVVVFGANEAPKVTSRIEPDSIMIGDRFTYVIDVEKDTAQEVAFPEFEADPKGGIELIESLPVDTISREGRRLHLRKRYTMAAFEEGRIAMGGASVLYADKNIIDTLTSDNESILYVATFQIDSTSHAIFDIKPQKSMTFKFREVSGYLLWALLAAVVLAAAIYGLVRYLNARGKSIKSLFTPAPPEPAHIVAIRALEAQRSFSSVNIQSIALRSTSIKRYGSLESADLLGCFFTIFKIVSAAILECFATELFKSSEK